jgi:hypothetical protein
MDASIQDGQIHFFPPSEWMMSSPYGSERYVTYDHQVTIFADIPGALTLLAILVLMSLALVNGLVLLGRRRNPADKQEANWHSSEVTSKPSPD